MAHVRRAVQRCQPPWSDHKLDGLAEAEPYHISTVNSVAIKKIQKNLIAMASDLIAMASPY